MEGEGCVVPASTTHEAETANEECVGAYLVSTDSTTQSQGIVEDLLGSVASTLDNSNTLDDEVSQAIQEQQELLRSSGSPGNINSHSDSLLSASETALSFGPEEASGAGFPTDSDGVVVFDDERVGAGFQSITTTEDGKGGGTDGSPEVLGHVKDTEVSHAEVRDSESDPTQGKQLASPEPKQGFASLRQNTAKGSCASPSRLQMSRSSKGGSSVSSRNSSLSSGTPPRKKSGSVSLPSRGAVSGKSLGERLEAALGERTGPSDGDPRVLVGPSSGLNLRAAGSPDSSVSSQRTRRGGRGQSLPGSGSRGLTGAARVALSSGSTPRSSRSPEAKRSSMSFGEYVAKSHSELSLLDASRHSMSATKRARDRDALRVAVRVRPIITREAGSRTVACEGGDARLVVVNPKKFKASADAVLATASAVSRANMTTSDWLRPFDFDRVFWSNSSGTKSGSKNESGEGSAAGASSPATQRSVYEALGERIVEDALNGVHCSCFAYGHTGSGKTFSMFGNDDRSVLPDDPAALAAAPTGDGFGLVPRVCYELLNRLKDGAPNEPESPGINMTVQFVEIYNDKIRDLLHPGADSGAFRVREHPQTGPYVDNLVPVQVESWNQLRQLLVLGCSARTERDTPENTKSSRGHAILTLEAQTPAGPSRVQMVDLAGSERETTSTIRQEIGGVDGRNRGGRRDSGGGESGDGRTLSQRLRETAQIKKALSNLGIIIKGLSRGDRAVGLPFRDSILTWLLKEALSGRAHTTMLATISPSSDNYVETMNTLKYAERLRKASAHQYWNRGLAGGKSTKPPDGIKKEMESLVEQLGADGVEAKRQVLYQTVSDPQQRIAKLTMKDPRRARRFSDSGVAMPTRSRFTMDDADDEPRRTTYPGTLSPKRLERNPSSPPRDAGNFQSGPNDEGGAAWGSPIDALEDMSVEVVITGEPAGIGDKERRPSLGGSRVSFSTQTEANPGKGGDGVGPGSEIAQPAGEDEEEILFSPDNARYNHRVRQDHGEEDAGGEEEDDENSAGGEKEEEPAQLYSESESGMEAEGDGGGVSVAARPEVQDRVDEDDYDPVEAADAHKAQQHKTPPDPYVGNMNGVDNVSIPESSELLVDSVADANNLNQKSRSARQEGTCPASPDDRPGLSWAGTSSSPSDEVQINDVTGGDVTATAQSSEGTRSSTSAHRPQMQQSTERLDHASQFAAADIVDDLADTPRIDRMSRYPRQESNNARASAQGGSTIANPDVPPPRRVSWEQQQEQEQEEFYAGRGTTRPISRARFPVQTRTNSRRGGDVASPFDDDMAIGGTENDTMDPIQAHDAGSAAYANEDHSPPAESLFNMSQEFGSGGGAAALAASGVFDVSGTSAEAGGHEDEDGISVGDADSLDGEGQEVEEEHQEAAWTLQQPQRGDGSSGGKPLTQDAVAEASQEDVRGLIEDLTRQVRQLQDSNAALREEVRRLETDLGRKEESEEQAWAANAENIRACDEFRARLSGMQRNVHDESMLARDAEKRALQATSRADVVANELNDLKGVLKNARERAKEAGNRAAEHEANADKYLARANEDGERLAAFREALDEQILKTQEASRQAERSEAALQAAGGDADAAVTAAQQTARKERARAEKAEARLQRTEQYSRQLASAVDQQKKELAEVTKALEEEGAKAAAAEKYEQRAAEREQELNNLLRDRDRELARARAEAAKAVAVGSEATECRMKAEEQARELARLLKQERAQLEKADEENQRVLAEVRAAAEKEMERSEARRADILEERDRAVEQVASERIHALRLDGELNNLRSTARQDAKAAHEKEAELQALLADEAEASRAEQTNVEELLSLISSARGSASTSTGVHGAVTIAGACSVLEAERAELEAVRRRLRSVEEENRALKQRNAEQASLVPSERMRELEEDKRSLMREREALIKRLGERDARLQVLTREQETQAAVRRPTHDELTQTAIVGGGREHNARTQEYDGELPGLKERVGREGEAMEKARLRGEEVGSELQDLRERAAKEDERRAALTRDFEERLGKVKKESEKNTSRVIQGVCGGVRAQAKHIQDTVKGLETERDQARQAKNAATKELEDVKGRMETLGAEHEQIKKSYEDQIEQTKRERAALWLAVNRLDVLEAAKDSIIKDLQADGEMKKRSLNSLQKENDRLKRELGQVDISLMQALEDNGLELDSFRLQNTVISRRLGRRSVRVQRSDCTNGHGAVAGPVPPISSSGPAVFGESASPARVRSMTRSGVSLGAYGRDEGGSVWMANAGMVAGRDPVSTSRRRNAQELHADGAPGTREGGRKLELGSNFVNDGMIGVRGAHEAQPSSRLVTARIPSLSVRADHWDPAINTIEREIEQLSDRLNGQAHGSNIADATARIRRPSSHADFAGGAPLDQNHHGNPNNDSDRNPSTSYEASVSDSWDQGPFISQEASATSGNTGKKSRVKSAEVPPARIPETQRPQKERGSLP